MSLTGERRLSRHRAIIDLLNKNPLSIKELSEILTTSYHTIRNDMTSLTDEGKVSATLETRHGATLFRVGKVRPMPMVYHKASNQTLPLTAILDSYAKNPHDSASARAALDVPSIAAELLYTLAVSTDQGHPNCEPLENKNRLFAALRTRLTTDILHIESILSIARDMLKDENLWSANGLSAIEGDSLFDPTHIISLYETVLQERNSQG